MSLWHNASSDVVRIQWMMVDPADQVEKATTLVCEAGDELDVPDGFDALVPMHAPQMKKGAAPESKKVSPPPPDPKKSASKPQG